MGSYSFSQPTSIAPHPVGMSKPAYPVASASPVPVTIRGGGPPVTRPPVTIRGGGPPVRLPPVVAPGGGAQGVPIIAGGPYPGGPGGVAQPGPIVQGQSGAAIANGTGAAAIAGAMSPYAPVSALSPSVRAVTFSQGWAPSHAQGGLAGIR